MLVDAEGGALSRSTAHASQCPRSALRCSEVNPLMSRTSGGTPLARMRDTSFSCGGGSSSVSVFLGSPTTLEATQGQMDGVFSQLPYTCHLEEVASVGD